MDKSYVKMALTKREAEILQYIASGKTSAEIAKELFIAKLTVDKHRQNMLEKAGVKNCAELIQRWNQIFG